MKKGLLVLLAGYIGFSLYCILVFFYGKSGFFELKALMEYRDRLVTNNAELRERGNALYREAQILVSDPEVLALKARELGYLKPEQGRICLEGYESREQSYALGKVLKWDGRVRDRSLLFRTVGMGIGLFAVLLFLIARTGTTARRRE